MAGKKSRGKTGKKSRGKTGKKSRGKTGKKSRGKTGKKVPWKDWGKSRGERLEKSPGERLGKVLGGSRGKSWKTVILECKVTGRIQYFFEFYYIFNIFASNMDVRGFALGKARVRRHGRGLQAARNGRTQFPI